MVQEAIMADKVLTNKHNYDVLTSAKLASKVRGYSTEQAKELAESAIASTSDLQTKLQDVQANANAIAKARIDATELNSWSKQIMDEIDGAVKAELNEAELTLEAPEYGVEFALSKPKVTTTYNTELLKAERPDVWRKVAHKAGKPMPAKDREALEAQIAEKEAELQELTKKLAQDNAAKQTIFSEDMFDAMLEADDSLSKYKTTTSNSSRFYFRNMK